MTQENYWIAMVTLNDEFYVLASKEGDAINDFGSRKQALNFFTNAYDKARLRSPEGSGSAKFSYLITQPRVLEVDLATLTTKLFDENKGIQVKSLGASLGFLKGLTCNRDYKTIKKLYDSGESPKL